MTAPADSAIRPLFERLVRDGRIYELAHVMVPGMPIFPAHAPYTLTLNRRHGDPHARPRPGKSSFANEVIVMPGHTATHIDALGHFSRAGKVYGGCPAGDIETHQGLSRLDISAIAPIWRRAVMLDVAAYRKVDVLAAGAAVRAEELQAIAAAQQVTVEVGDVILIRTGWARHWTAAPAIFNGGEGGFPGPDSDGAAWLLEHRAGMAGSDTPAFEAIPYPGDSVHAMLLVDNGIHIMENLNLEELARDRVYSFLFIALPLRIFGGTGSPMRPIAVV
ncbi:MAG: cyclase family protein [Candidatus Binataceae bacterium]